MDGVCPEQWRRWWINVTRVVKAKHTRLQVLQPAFGNTAAVLDTPVVLVELFVLSTSCASSCHHGWPIPTPHPSNHEIA